MRFARAAAKSAFEEAVAVMRALAEREAGNRDWKRDFATTLYDFGAVMLAQKDNAGARAAYVEGIESSPS
jgi:hypothetical protein